MDKFVTRLPRVHGASDTSSDNIIITECMEKTVKETTEARTPENVLKTGGDFVIPKDRFSRDEYIR